MSNPPLVYRETVWNMRRRFELFDDRIIVRYKSIHLDGETTIRLGDLDPESDRLRIRPLKPFRITLLILVIGVVGLIASFVKPELHRQYNLGYQSAALIMVPLFCFVMVGRKVEYVRFKSKAGIVVLDMGKSGPDKRLFDSFVEELHARISNRRPRDTQ